MRNPSKRHRRVSRLLPAGLVVASALAMAGCGVLPQRGGRSDPTATSPAKGASPTSAAAREGLVKEPTNPCSAISAATAAQFKLTRPSKGVLPGADIDPTTGAISDYNFVRCSWTIDNPAKGANGKPNFIDFTITYVVIAQKYPNAEETAKQLFLSQKEKLTKSDAKKEVKHTEASADLGDEAVYIFTLDAGSVGPGATSTLLIKKANSYITVSSSGADLKTDPAKPIGHNLVTTALPEERLKPTVMGTAAEVVALLH